MIPAIGTAQWYKVIIAAAERNTQGKTLQNYCETSIHNGTPNGAARSTCPTQACDSDSFYFSPGAVNNRWGVDSALLRCALSRAGGRRCSWDMVMNEIFGQRAQKVLPSRD